MDNSKPPATFDPYDLWSTRLGVYAKRAFYKGKAKGKLLSISIALADWLLPNLSRLVSKAEKQTYPITTAQWLLSQEKFDDPVSALEQLMSTASPEEEKFGSAWGLGFPWMSKNGLYGDEIPFITHTPYAMEALLHLAQFECVREKALNRFNNTWTFLEALHVMHESQDSLALSYAPIVEPRMVVNANSYASLAYSLHFITDQNNLQAKEKAIKLARWVVEQQETDGSWYYYADQEPGNFIDCFHSCFVIKNLIKAGESVAEIEEIARDAIRKGIAFIDNNFYDKQNQLVARFTERDIKDPFVWDLYDQAEYLGLLVYTDRLQEAEIFAAHVETVFHKKSHWYCRKDFFGRLYGKDFYRWGIMPFIYNRTLLKRKIEGNI